MVCTTNRNPNYLCTNKETCGNLSCRDGDYPSANTRNSSSVSKGGRVGGRFAALLALLKRRLTKLSPDGTE